MIGQDPSSTFPSVFYARKFLCMPTFCITHQAPIDSFHLKTNNPINKLNLFSSSEKKKRHLQDDLNSKI